MTLWLLGCAPPRLALTVDRDDSGASVSANVPLERVELRDGQGALVVARDLRPARSDVSLRAPLSEGAYTVRAVAAEQSVEASLSVAGFAPFDVRIEAPLGQESLRPGAPIPVPIGSRVRVGLVVTANQDGTLVSSSDAERDLVAGERHVVTLDLGDRPEIVELSMGGHARRIELRPEPVSMDALRGQTRVTSVRLPARPDGSIDGTVAAGRIDLPARWWDATLDRFGLGFRARDDQAPRTHISVTLHNDRPDPVNLIVSSRIEVDGQIHEAFRPRLRDAVRLDAVRRLVRVPPDGDVSVGLPVYLDRSKVDAIAGEAVVDVQVLGTSEMLHQVRSPIVVRRGTPWASALFMVGVLGALAGWLVLLARWRSWIARPTRELTTIAVFGSLSFTIGVASQVLGLGLASVLGPFAPFVIGLFDDAVRLCLLATLLALVPRPGVFALGTLVGWMMGALALGAVHPVDVLYLGNTVVWTELGLWTVGITRPGRLHWLDSAPLVRLVGGICVPHAWGTALALAVSVVVYRLYYAELYVGSLVAIPGFLYAVIGCFFAVPFARSLRRIG